MDGHPGRVCIEYFEWMVEERDIIPREIHGYSLWPHMLFSPRVHTVTGGGKREAEEEKKYQERERERERRIEARRGGGMERVESFLFSKYRTQSDTLGSRARANINALHLVYIIMGV